MLDALVVPCHEPFVHGGFVGSDHTEPHRQDRPGGCQLAQDVLVGHQVAAPGAQTGGRVGDSGGEVARRYEPYSRSAHAVGHGGRHAVTDERVDVDAVLRSGVDGHDQSSSVRRRVRDEVLRSREPLSRVREEGRRRDARDSRSSSCSS